MATTIHEPLNIDKGRPAISGSGGGERSLSPNGVRLPAVQDYAPPPASTAIWVLLASISMTFLALTSALIVRQGAALDWQHVTLPRILYFNTAVLIASSVTLAIGRRKVAVSVGPLAQPVAHPTRWLNVTLALGLLFVAGQYVAWLQLRSQGLYLATNPNSSFFYLLTAMHALHVFGGLGGLTRVIYKLNRSILKKTTLDAAARYWHFMDVLWIYLLWLLWAKI